MKKDPLKDCWLQTYRGLRFRPFAAALEQIGIEDIAHGLAGTFRFAGQSARYTVAQHCVLVSQHLEQQHALWGLLHDAAEAWLPDVPAPIKRYLFFHLPDGREVSFDALEESILRVVAERFELPWPMPAEVIEADRRMLATERLALFRDELPWPGLAGIEPYANVNRLGLDWEPAIAKGAFLDEFEIIVEMLASESAHQSDA